MLDVIKTDEFAAWLSGLSDRVAAARIAARIDRAGNGNLGDWKAIRGGISEMRVNVGQGYRLYFARREGTIIILLCGGNKATQDADIRRAIELSRKWETDS